ASPPSMHERLSEANRRIAAALARAALPPGRRLAGGGPATVDRLEEVLNGFPGRAVRGYSALLQVLEQGSSATHGGRAFSALEPGDAEHHLVALADGGVPQRALALGLTMPLKVAYF